MSEAVQNKGRSPDLSSVISSLMSNPEVMSAISSLKKESISQEKEDIPESIATSAVPNSDMSIDKLLPMITELSATVGRSKDRGKSTPAVCLLTALKPYLSPHRQEAVETIVRLSSISEILGSIK